MTRKEWFLSAYRKYDTPLARILLRKKVTVGELSKMTRIHRSTLLALVSGQNAGTKPSREKRICAALGISEIK
jgi:DNA-binding Xre family transcriptional regulator